MRTSFLNICFPKNYDSVYMLHAEGGGLLDS